MVHRIQAARAVKPCESDGVDDSTEVNMFTRTWVMSMMILVNVKVRMNANQQGGEQCSKASRIGGWWDEETHRGDRNKHPWKSSSSERALVFHKEGV